MLTHTFRHLPGIGKFSDLRLKEAGLRTWEEALRAEKLPLKSSLCPLVAAGLAESAERLAAGDALWFSDRLPAPEQWRLFPHFHARAAYVDIETTGFSRPNDCITCIALYDGASLKTYVQGRNLEDFADDILKYELLITWNGRAFDAPFIRRALQIPLRMAHLDLFPVFRSLGIKGGLKKVEKSLGLERQGLDGVDGYMAVLLWREYQRSGGENALETLLAYNAEDVLSLEHLCRHACSLHGIHIEPAAACANPFRPDAALLARLCRYLPDRGC
ncbi:MAG: ribonuclease H-like domain-containing protein [Deltaproteobacteria bacterium]|jgi:uncharacterized protein YprB with RNaseH-like and TPR domain|nr:ribonuclease H-like domain-containing protein [Deltaproteobacteria bacterium]